MPQVAPVPPWLAGIPRFTLIDGPSALQPLARFSRALRDRGAPSGLRVWIKREDLLPLALGGNKLRNLELLVGEALALGADTLVTSGRPWSNHCRLTAAAASRAGLGCHVVLTGPAPAVAGPGQLLMAAFGANVHFTAHDERVERTALVDSMCMEISASDHQPYRMEVGGSSEVGALGQVLAGLELADQARTAGIRPTAILLASATGGTQAGLLVGTSLGGLEPRIIGLSVNQPPEELESVIADLSARLAARTRASGNLAPVELLDARGPGYGRRWQAADEAADLLARTEAILADPIYTAKGLAGLMSAAIDGTLDGDVVFWHGGGTPGLFEALEG